MQQEEKETENGSSLQTAACSNYAPVPVSTYELVALLPSKIPIDRKLPSVWRRINSRCRHFIHVDVILFCWSSLYRVDSHSCGECHGVSAHVLAVDSKLRHG